VKLTGVNQSDMRQCSLVFCGILAVCAILLLWACAWGEEGIHATASATGVGIPEESIARLRKRLTGADEIESSTEKRRTCKSVVRRAQSLLKKYPASPNRFLVLAAIFESQKTLFALDDSTQNRDAIFETCRALAKAPDEYAEIRLPADVLLTQARLARPGEGKSKNEAGEAITELVSRYEGTAMEADSLIMASMIAMEAGDREVLKTLLAVLSERFPDVPSVKAFLRERFSKAERDFVLRGNFTRPDGSTLCLPIDRLGHPYLVCFWSEGMDYIEDRLLAIKAMQKKYPGRFEVFSFNLDELPDFGQGRLRRLGLDWIPMALPGGLNSDMYLKYGRVSETPFALLGVNERGYVRGKSNRKLPSVEQEVESILSSRQIGIRDPSFFALMQSVLIGDFLVTEPYGPTDALRPVEFREFAPDTHQVTRASYTRTGASVPQDKLRDIQACFTPPAIRCRLGKGKALANYSKAEQLCRSVIKSRPDAPDIFLARNRRIVALMGMWNLTGQGKYLDSAVQEANNVPCRDLPLGARIVSQFCIARHAIRKNPENAATVIASFVKACGGEKAGGPAHAGAVILALDADGRDLYLKYRTIIMEKFAEDNRTWPVASLLLGRTCAGTLFDASGVYGVAYNGTGWRVDELKPRMFRADLTTLDGRKVDFSSGIEGRHHVVVFMEPSIDANDAKVHKELIDGLQQAVDDHRDKKMKLVVAFLTEDTKLARTIVTQNRWKCDVACIPGGPNSSLAVRLGVFSRDRLPRTFVVSCEGRVQGVFDGVGVSRDYYGKRQSRDRHGTLYILRAVKMVVRKYDTDKGDKALKGKDYRQAAKYLAVSFPARPVNAYNRHARNSLRANLALENWQAALKDVDTVLKDPSWRHPAHRAADGRTREMILKHIHKQSK